MNDLKEDTDFLDFLKDDFEILPSDRHEAVEEIERHLPMINKLSLVAKNMVVEDAEQCGRAFDLTADIRTLTKTIDDLRKKAIEPSRRIVQMINDSAKGLQEILSIAENEIKIRIASYQLKEEEKRKAAEESVREFSEKLGVDILIPDETRLVKSSKASSYYKEVTTFEITDASVVPDEYWVIDESLLQKHVDLGKRDIPGVRIVKDKKFIVRRK